MKGLNYEKFYFRHNNCLYIVWDLYLDKNKIIDNAMS